MGIGEMGRGVALCPAFSSFLKHFADSDSVSTGEKGHSCGYIFIAGINLARSAD